ncbi:MAG: hypothetical protein KAR57_05240 [Bacteroidales bacterium]|nr:hypothetical protein [Bacteroidales bacterium]
MERQRRKKKNRLIWNEFRKFLKKYYLEISIFLMIFLPILYHWLGM